MTTKKKDRPAGRSSTSASLHQIVLEVLSERRKPAGRKTPLTTVNSPVKPDRETLRKSLSVLVRKQACEITDSELDKTIENIELEGSDEAELVAAYLHQVVAHLRSLKCTTRDGIFEYFAAGDRVLLELYAELQRSRPSPTRLRQLTVQYALDPRYCIDASAHQIEIRTNDNGYEIAIAPPGTMHSKAIPLPGTLVNDLFKRRMIDFATQEPPRYLELVQLIEMLLGYVPRENEDTVRQELPTSDVQVDVDDSSIIVFGRRYVVDLQQVRFMQLLLKAPGVWISTPKFHADPLFKGVRMDRIRDKLPSVMLDLIESKGGKGYRLMVEHLE